MTDRMCSKGCGVKAVARGLCGTHWMSWRRAQGDAFISLRGNPVARFWEKVDKRGPDDCWPWLGYVEPSGYGHFQATYQGVRFTKSHRFGYHIASGPVPEGLDLDHVCHTRDEECRAGDDCPHRRCCNPAHLEPVTERVNILRSTTGSAVNARKTHCIHGHPFAGDNLRITKQGTRLCMECRRARGRRAYEAKKRQRELGEAA